MFNAVHHNLIACAVRPRCNLPRHLTQVLINGKFADSQSGKTFPVVDPRTEEVIMRVAEADKADVNLAVAAAREAFDNGPWPKMTAKVWQYHPPFPGTRSPARAMHTLCCLLLRSL